MGRYIRISLIVQCDLAALGRDVINSRARLSLLGAETRRIVGAILDVRSPHTPPEFQLNPTASTGPQEACKAQEPRPGTLLSTYVSIAAGHVRRYSDEETCIY